MTNIQDLLKQKAQIEAQIEQARTAERSSAVEQVKALISTHGLSVEEVFGRGRKKATTAGRKVEPKYRDPVSGQTWSGRGRSPAWLRGKSRDEFKIG